MILPRIFDLGKKVCVRTTAFNTTLNWTCLLAEKIFLSQAFDRGNIHAYNKAANKVQCFQDAEAHAAQHVIAYRISLR
jgi:hypothetical protein